MQFPQMLYRFPADRGEPVQLQDGAYSTMIVHNADDLENSLADGWFESPADARKTDDVFISDALPTRAELEQKATELDLRFDGRTSDKKLNDMITAAL